MSDVIFARHQRRRVTDLSGMWDFAYLGDVNADDVHVEAITFDDCMPVPACFDATPRYAGKRGLVAYRTTIAADDASRYRLVFDGVHHWSRTFIAGRPIGDHAGGFTRYHHDFTNDGCDFELIVIVNNRLSPTPSPLHQEHYDWYHYGGIARGVELHALPDTYIESVRCVTESIDPPQIRVTLTAASTAAAAPLAITFAEQTLHNAELAFIDGHAQFSETFDLPADTLLWSPTAPHLHRLSITLGDDDWHERIGLRTVARRGREVLVNNEPVRLLGFNRHEAHPQFGHTQPLQLINNDLQLLRELGCNFLRGSHYPQDRRTLDLCDELGILVWCEGTAWGNTAEDAADPAFVTAQMTNIDEMIGAAHNHPSIIMWGVLNEGPSDSVPSREVYVQLLNRLREQDPHRLVTYASNRPNRDICYDLADVIALNLYPGWYNGGLDNIEPFFDGVTTLIAEMGQDDKPLLISETGGGAILGTRDPARALWSEEYQAELLDTVIRHLFMDRDRACGIAIWQFCDTRSSDHRPRALLRPRSFNNKGVVDEYRRPKLAYTRVRELFHQLNEATGD